MRKLIVFLHGLNGNAETWGTLPDLVTATLGGDYSSLCPVYHATRFSPANHDRSADQVLTALLKEEKDKDLIFLVGYSDGGLIARAMCKKLLLDPKRDALTNKLVGVITVGTPLEGIRFGAGIAKAFSRTLPFKLSEIVQRPILSDGYASAIETAKQRKVKRPSHYHIQIEADRYVAPLIEEHFTEDDDFAGTIFGGHTDFISTREKAVRLTNELIEVIRERENLLARPYFATQAESLAATLPDRVVLLACSDRKTPGGSPDYTGTALEFLSDGLLRDRILSKRTHVFRRLKNSKIEDGFNINSNRIHQKPNQLLKYGADFGGLSEKSGATYLPAHLRYAGKSYVPIPSTTWEGLDRSTLSVLIMSGLYGIIDAHEFIQEYDIHLTDTDREAGINLSGAWIDLFTQTLAAYVERSYKGREVRIFNLLCDPDYVGSVRWHQLPSEKCSLFHLMSKEFSWKELLACAGTIADAMIKNPDVMEKMKCVDHGGPEHDVSYFGLPPPGLPPGKVAFESRVVLGK